MSETLSGFSIIIPVRNGQATLADTLRSIANLEADTHEVIVVDDASTDRTVRIAEDFGARVISMPEPSGPAAARNKGAQEAQYPILVFTDSDVLAPKKLLSLLKKSFMQSEADCVQGTFSDVCPYADFFSQYKNLYNRYVINQLPEWIDTTYTSLTAVRKSAFLDSGGFDEGIRTASVEDRTLGRNLIRNGYRIYLDRHIEVVHNKKLNAQKFYRNQFHRSRDLAKLLLRNREEAKEAEEEGQEVDSFAEQGRFGTNSATAMMRLPIALAVILFSGIAIWQPLFLIMTAVLIVHFCYLITPFTFYLLRKRGPFFALASVLVNFSDAIVSGAGVMWGFFQYGVMRQRY